MSDTDTPDRTAADWLASFCELIGERAPDDHTIEVLLELAGVAAHSSERIAAPIACYLVGRAGLQPSAALAMARQI